MSIDISSKKVNLRVKVNFRVTIANQMSNLNLESKIQITSQNDENWMSN